MHPRVFSSFLTIHAQVFALILVFFGVAQAQAIPHLDQLNRAYGQSVEKNLLQVVGPQGQPNPTTWLLYSRDPVNPRLVIEFTLENGKLTRARRLNDAGNETPIIRNKVKITPLAAFQAAERVAIKDKVGYDSADHSLSNNPATGLPEWTLTLKDKNKQVLGKVRVSATTGKVLGTTWRPASGSPNATAPQGIGEGASQIGQGALDVGRGIGRGVGRGLNSMGNWLQELGQPQP